jgi:hypothetical protein
LSGKLKGPFPLFSKRRGSKLHAIGFFGLFLPQIAHAIVANERCRSGATADGKFIVEVAFAGTSA